MKIVHKLYPKRLRYKYSLFPAKLTRVNITLALQC